MVNSMSEFENVFKAYKQREFEKVKEMRDRVCSLDALSAITIPALYPELSWMMIKRLVFLIPLPQ